MGKKGKTRQKVDPRSVHTGDEPAKRRKEKDWGFEDIARSKTRRR